MTEKETYDLTKFDGMNFALWKFSVVLVLEAQDLTEFVEGTDTEPDKASQLVAWKIWKKRQSKTSMTLLSSVNKSLHVNLINCDTPNKIWNKLQSLYGDSSEDAKQDCWQQFYDFRIKEGESAAMQIEKLETICKILEDAGEKPPESAVMSKLLSSLPCRFSAFTMAWECTAKAERKKENLIARIIREDKRLSAAEEESSSLAVQVKALQLKLSKQLNPTSSEKKATGPGPRSKDKKKRIEELKKKTSCKYCNETGHWYRECKKRIADEAKAEKKVNTSAEAYVCDISAFFSETTDNDKTVWLADSGASLHMTGHREFFSELGPVGKTRFVKIASDSVLPVTGVGTIELCAKVGGQIVDRKLTNVLLVPELKRNLFSVGAINDKQFSFHSYRDHCEVRDRNGALSAEGVRHGSLFRMLFEVKVQPECNVAEVNSLKSWHERLGHINVGYINATERLDAVSGLKITDKSEFFCEACTLGKHARKQHSSSKKPRAENPGEKIHSDVCGPVSVQSITGSKYFLLCKDDCTGYRSVFFMRHKNEVFEKFKSYEAFVAKQTGNNIKVLRSDNGGEYLAHEFGNFLRSKGIIHELSSPYIHEQNGRAEREMRTLCESARTMLLARNLPKELWEEAVRTAAYVLNRTVSKQSGKVTPYERWFKVKPEVKHMRVFGCDAYLHVPKETRKKNDSKSTKVLFVGYSGESSNYRLWDPITRKIHVSSDVIFNESMTHIEPADPRLQQEQAVLDFGNEDQPDPELNPIPPAAEQVELDPDPEGQPGREAAAFQLPVELQWEEYHPEPGRQLRDRGQLQMPQRYDDYVLVAGTLPTTYEDAIASTKAKKWVHAMVDEMESLYQNKTWDFTKLPAGKHAIGCRWLFNEKVNTKGDIRYKARLVAKGFAQREGVDYCDTFAPVVRYESIRMLLALAATEDFEIAQFDVKTAFLNGELKEEIYMQQPPGFEDKAQPEAVCRLRRSLYGLKQSPRCWNEKFVEFLEKFKFHQTESDFCVFSGKVNEATVYLALYVDDGLLMSASQSAIDTVLHNLKQCFQITTDTVDQFIGIEIQRNRKEHTIKIHQSAYIRKILRRFNMEDAKPSTVPAEPGVHLSQQQCPKEDNEMKPMLNVPYREAIGSLLFAAKVSRPDIEYAVNQASQFITNYGPEHWQAVKKILRYLKGTINCGIVYGGSGSNMNLGGFTDADYAGNVDTRKSTSGFVFMLNGGAISWSSERQRVVALSTTEAEYITLSNGTKDAVWILRIMCELGIKCNQIPMYVDNQSAIKLAGNPEYHRRTKHIDVRFHFERDVYERGDIDVRYIESKEQLADIFTKPLTRYQFQYLRKNLGLEDESK